MHFQLKSPFHPTGDQPRAIASLVKNFQDKKKAQTLLGVTGSGKTFTMAQVIDKLQMPTLVLSHNKTLAAQLYSEFKEFFPKNAVHYFVSYYDYYQPEAYLPQTNTYIEKDAQINDHIDQLRHAATSSLLERNDTLIVSSISCIYGLGSPQEYKDLQLFLKVGQKWDFHQLFERLFEMQYQRNEDDFHRGTFRVRGDVVDIFPVYEEEKIIRLEFFDQTLESICLLDPLRGIQIASLSKIHLYPASHYVTTSENRKHAMVSIKKELQDHILFLKKQKKLKEAQRIQERTLYDLEMLDQLGFCHGIENYARHLTQRAPDTPPPTLLDYFSKPWLLIVDESHVTIPQIGAMYRGDRSRKQTLIEHGFRLPSALDNRPLMFSEWEQAIELILFVSATPGAYEHKKTHPLIIEQLIRPTGLLDPEIEVRPAKEQVKDLQKEIQNRIQFQERVLVTTLTKKLSEDLAKFLNQKDIPTKYLHSGIDTLERIQILKDLRLGNFSVLVGVNLLREGLDLPEVSLVAILDADKEGFLRSARALIQTIGRTARNIHGKAILYADRITPSMQQALDETYRRRKIQSEYNKKHHIQPKSIQKSIYTPILEETGFEKPLSSLSTLSPATHDALLSLLDLSDETALIEKVKKITGSFYLGLERISESMKQIEIQMRTYARSLEFEKAALLRDRLRILKTLALEIGKIERKPLTKKNKSS